MHVFMEHAQTFLRDTHTRTDVMACLSLVSPNESLLKSYVGAEMPPYRAPTVMVGLILR